MRTNKEQIEYIGLLLIGILLALAIWVITYHPEWIREILTGVRR